MSDLELSNELDRLASEAATAAAPVFKLNDWKYNRAQGRESFVPSEAHLALTVRRLLASAVKAAEGDVSFGTGRFHVSRATDEGSTIYSVLLELGEHDVQPEAGPLA
jgi:hypothetical protein